MKTVSFDIQSQRLMDATAKQQCNVRWILYFVLQAVNLNMERLYILIIVYAPGRIIFLSTDK